MNLIKPSKYPRTPHLPWSKSMTVDDVVVTSTSYKDVMLTEKKWMVKTRHCTMTKFRLGV